MHPESLLSYDDRGWLADTAAGGGSDDNLMWDTCPLTDTVPEMPPGGEEGGRTLEKGPWTSEEGRGGRRERMKRGPWSAEEDRKLIKWVEKHGTGSWEVSGLARSSKSCCLRWNNHLQPNIKKGSFTQEEEELILKLHLKYGNKWTLIASKLSGRKDHDIKDFLNSRLKKGKKQKVPFYPLLEKEETTPKNILIGNDADNYYCDGTNYNISADDTGDTFLPSPLQSPQIQRAAAHEFSQQQQQNASFDMHQTFAKTSAPSPPTYHSVQLTFLASSSPEDQCFLPYHQLLSSPRQGSSGKPSSPSLYSNQMPFHAYASPQPWLSSSNYQPLSSPGQLSSSEQPATINSSFQNQIISTPHMLSSPHQSEGRNGESNRTAVLASASSPQMQASPSQQSHCPPMQQVSPKRHKNFSPINSPTFAFTPSRTPPILSWPPVKLKRRQRGNSQLPLPPKPIQSSSPLHVHPLPKPDSASPLTQLKPQTSGPQTSPVSLNLPNPASPISPLGLSLSMQGAKSSSKDWNMSTISSQASLLMQNPSRPVTVSPPFSLLSEKRSPRSLNMNLLIPKDLQENIGPSTMLPPIFSPKNNSPILEESLSSPVLTSSPAASPIPTVQFKCPSLGQDMPPTRHTQLNPTVKSEPPSIQTPEAALEPNPGVKINYHAEKAECNYELVSTSQKEPQAMLQENPSSRNLLYGSPRTGSFLVGSLKTIDSDTTARNSDISPNTASKRETLSSGKFKRQRLLNPSSKEKGFIDRSTRVTALSKSSSIENIVENFSRREGSLSEISKAGILLVESARKDVLLSKLLKREGSLNESSKQESLSQSLLKGEPLLVQTLRGEDSIKRTCSINVTLENEGSSSKNLRVVSLLDQFKESLLPKGLGREDLNWQVQKPVLPELYLPSKPDTTPLLRESSLKKRPKKTSFGDKNLAESLNREKSSASQKQKNILNAFGPIFDTSTDVTPVEPDGKGNVFRSPRYFGGSLGREFSGNLKLGSAENQSLMTGLLTEDSVEENLLVSKEELLALPESCLFSGQLHSMDDLLISGSGGSTSEGEFLVEGMNMDDTWRDNLETENSLEQSLQEESLEESSRQLYVSPDEKPSLNVFGLEACGSNTDNLPVSAGRNGESDFAQCSSGAKLGEKPEYSMGCKSEELLSILEFLPATIGIPEWYSNGDEISGIQSFDEMDVTLGLDVMGQDASRLQYSEELDATFGLQTPLVFSTLPLAMTEHN